ncbi:MAG: hypothetical protein R3176_11470 [Woeseiaceae bacterium]|nr:hypothetical protein [Woeseiaceae bacterium]
MDESLRNSIDKVIVVGGLDPADSEVSGTYEEMTPGLYGGINRGAAIGRPSMEIGPVNVNFPIPILTLPGAIVGGISGKAKREMQEFRDALTEELASQANQPLNNSRLALGVFRNLDPLPGLEAGLFAESTPVPEDADAILFVNIDSIGIEVDGDDAILTTTASLSVNRRDDNSRLYERVVSYQDRAALTAWTDNDNALFRDYANFALHFLGREIAAESFERVALPVDLTPRQSDTLKLERHSEWRGTSKSKSPMLRWNVAPRGEAETGLAGQLPDTAQLAYDVEIYDERRIVYSVSGVQGSEHRPGIALEPCRTYFWSVRPSYRLPGGTRYGHWMRAASAGSRTSAADIVGRDAARAPAYVQDFARLAIDCRAR